MVATGIKTDAEIQQAVLRELKWDTRVEETDVGVEVDRGTVTLTGTVSSYAKKLAAAEAAHRVKGVLDVANDIKVRVPGTGRTDTDIAQAVRRALEWDTRVPEEQIQSTVTDGWVTLSGKAERYSQREDAERAVRNLVGVRGITNRIEVAYVPHYVSTFQLREAIEDALERRAERAAERIRVSESHGIVTLRGEVQSWFERQAILGTVRHAPGVREVRDEMSYAGARS
jgi:osmotically-inducible protein OsmY